MSALIGYFGLTHMQQIVILCSAANFINAADRVIMPTAIVQMSELYKWDMHNQGWILSSFSVGYMASGVSSKHNESNSLTNFYSVLASCGVVFVYSNVQIQPSMTVQKFWLNFPNIFCSF